MKIEAHVPHGQLGTYIEALIHYRDFYPDHSVERVVPTGHSFLIFELDGFDRQIIDNETLEPTATFSKVWFVGMHKRYLSISAHQNSSMFVIQFKPFGAYPFLDSPMHELKDSILPAETLFGEGILQLREEILAQASPADVFACAETWLMANQLEGKDPDDALVDMVEGLRANATESYSKIISSYPKSQKHLIDQFKKYLGLTPKYYHRLLRFNEILQLIHKSQTIEWSQIAYQCEYSDQSHFIKEFKHFSGINPQKFIRHNFHNYEDVNFFPLDREG